MMEWLAAYEGSAFGTWLRESTSIWAYPAVLTLHTLGLAALVGASAVLDLRLLGCAPGIPIAPLRRLFPVMWAGFWVNALSGVALLAADATTKATTLLFAAKLGIVAAAVIVLVLIKRRVFDAGTAAATPPRAVAALAGASLTLWVLAIATGRYMAYF